LKEIGVLAASIEKRDLCSERKGIIIYFLDKKTYGETHEND